MCLIAIQKIDKENLYSKQDEFIQSFGDSRYPITEDWLSFYQQYLDVKVAEEDIVCYKWLTLGDEGLMSPYRGTPYEFRTYIESDESIKIDGFYLERTDKSFAVYGFNVRHGIHAYTAKDAHCVFDGPLQYKAIIPKGTRYVEGKYSSIVAEKLYLTDELVHNLK